MDANVNSDDKGRLSRKDKINQILQSPDIKAKAEQLMQKRLGLVPLWINQKYLQYSFTQEDFKGINQFEYELSLIGCFSPDQLMFMFGAWDEKDVKLYEGMCHHFKQNKNEQCTQIVEQICKGLNVPTDDVKRMIMPIVVISMELKDVLELASEKGVLFSHNEGILKGFYDLKKNLELYSLLNLNPQKRGYSFEDGTPPVYDWSANKLWDETEYNILYNTIMSVNRCGLPKQTLGLVLASRLVEARIVKSLKEIERHSFPYALKNPERFLQINGSCAFLKMKLRHDDMLSLQIRRLLTYHVIQEARNIFKAVYPDEKEIVLGWYDESTKNIIAKLPDEITKSKVKIEHNNAQKRNQMNTAKGKERNE